MRRTLAIVVLTAATVRAARLLGALAVTAAALAAPPGAALAQTPATGGSTAGAVETPTTAGGSSPASGGSAPTGVPPVQVAANGGNPYGRRFSIPPVVRSFSAAPRRVVFGGAPTRLRFRISAVGTLKRVRVRLTAQRAGARPIRVDLGRRPTNRTITVRWRRAGISPGAYILRLEAVDARGRAMARAARVGLVVRPKPRPKPRPAPAPSPSGSGVFPIAGSHSYGDGFGVDRGDHIHNGQDLPAASGTPLVAPRRATVFATGYSASGSGEYVVLYDSAANRSYVYFHLLRGSTAVSDGQTVSAGQRIGRVGSTGNSTGPHLHFELWAGRWFDGGHAIDPLPTLSAWDR